MLRFFSLLLVVSSVLSACTSTTLESTSTPVPIITESPAATSTSPPTPTSNPKPSQTVVPSTTPTVTPLAISDPLLVELEKRGYIRAKIASLTTTSLGGSTIFGGFDESQSSLLVQGQYAYLQYVSKETGNCHLIFIRSQADKYELIADIDASQLNPRIQALVTPDGDDFYPLLECSPMGWGDVNQNGKLDMPVTFIWGDRYIGSELHIFEITEEATVVDLTKDLPGIISPWSFNPESTSQVIIDLDWAGHDCIYPPIFIFWVYDWEEANYIDVTPQRDFAEYIGSLKSQITQAYGQPFNPFFLIEPLTELLLMYDRMGQRKTGWKEYLELTNLKNWPNTDARSLKWLQAEIDHFSRAYHSGLPFTPNDYCDPY
jgi:hypothetical protein